MAWFSMFLFDIKTNRDVILKDREFHCNVNFVEIFYL